MRFAGQFSWGYDNYTAERDELLGDMTLDEMIAEIKRRRVQTSAHHQPDK